MDDTRREIEKIIGDRDELELGVELEEQSVQLVIFTLANQFYAFFGNLVTSIAMMESTTPIPGTPDYILGVIYYQGRIESVMDIKKVLGLEDTEVTRKNRIIIAVSGEMQSGILVDTIEDVVDLPERRILEPLHTMEPAKREYVAGEIDYREKNVVILDLARIFERVLEQVNGGS